MTTFFDHFLGTYWGTPLTVMDSPLPGYAICIFAGKNVASPVSGVLHLNQRAQTGRFLANPHTFVLENDTERMEHGWGEPVGEEIEEETALPYPFHEWAHDKISDIIHALARRELNDILARTLQTQPQQIESWHKLHGRLNALRTMSPPRKTPWAWGMAQALCHHQLDEVHHCRQHIAEWAEYLTWPALLHPALQNIVSITCEISHDLWIPALLPLLHNLAHEDHPNAHIAVSHWLSQLGNPHLKRRWIDALMHSTHANAETMTILQKNRSA